MEDICCAEKKMKYALQKLLKALLYYRIIFTWITSSPQEKWREEIVNILLLSAKMSITTFPKLLSFTCHLPFTIIPEYPIYYILKIDPQNYILLSP